MILSASRRTDIPAFYGEWMQRRIKEGFVHVRNPMNNHQVSRFDISPGIVDCIVFWTKNPLNFIRFLDCYRDYTYYFHYTLTGYGEVLEPGVPSLEDSIICFQDLSRRIGAHKIIWRYDPIILTDIYTSRYHAERFRYLSTKLAGYTRKCVISFVDNYKKTMKNMAKHKQCSFSLENLQELSAILARLARLQNITIASCAETLDLSSVGITHGKCIDETLIEELSGYALDVKKDKNQRDACGCVTSIDIGAYNSCPHGCVYCYANNDIAIARRNLATHDSASPLLIGKIDGNDAITDRKVTGCRKLQQSLFTN